MIPTKLFHPHHLTTPHLDPPHLTSPITQWVEYYPPEFSTCITPPHFIWRKLYIDQQCNHIFNCETENEPKILYSVVYSKGEMFKAKVEEHREQVTALQQQAPSTQLPSLPPQETKIPSFGPCRGGLWIKVELTWPSRQGPRKKNCPGRFLN